MNRPQLAQQVESALTAMGGVVSSVEQVAATKKSLLASQTQMAASLAHDGNTVLTSALSDVYALAAPGRTPEEGSRLFHRVERALDHLIELNQRLLCAGRLTASGEEREVDLVLWVQRCVQDACARTRRTRATDSV